jgi:hypothetical protein
MAINPPHRYFIFEISDPADETMTTRATQDVNEAREAYKRGFFVVINEVVQSFLSTKQKVTTIISTDWTERTTL